MVRDQKKLEDLQNRYHSYKRNYAGNIKFDYNIDSLGNILLRTHNPLFHVFSEAHIPHPPLKMFQIYFNTVTYDEIERDVKVTLEAQLGLIGGTMGLLTGFSILSGVEIIYFAIKFLFRMFNNKS